MIRIILAVSLVVVTLGLPPNVQADGLPRVLIGEADLICDISARANGRQRLIIRNGGGLSFDATVSPLTDGVVEQRGPNKGAVYSFTSKLATPAKGFLSGVGKVTIESLATKVSVEISRYDQKKPGTTLTFVSGDVVNRDVYVEFSGVAIRGKKKYEFNINMGPVQFGSGSLLPASANYKSALDQKAVMLYAKTTTVVALAR